MALLACIWLAINIIEQEHGNGDMYRNLSRDPRITPQMKEAYQRQANSSDCAYYICIAFVSIIAFIFIGSAA